MQEAIPTRPPKPSTAPWTPEEQAEHRRELLEALDGWTWTHNTRAPYRRRDHLRLITPQNQQNDPTAA
ncbi:hypothetical protein QBA57_28720 [Streptomyces scabiei]|uniref:hypothetical protein n=1 Tax=Streptomyces scabiei TaxID=1930 RepID=UPI001B31FC14|nr:MULTISPECIES: hypothetical protein [Streptomyces]MBP5883148.1 hypothetical protein [Streptomyces sp. LBUM 1487]MDX2628610.1 hypothetical protein [Streptomyces scabiei]MDX3162724.1 hypothetical protein [Streptomyces scabiei]